MQYRILILLLMTLTFVTSCRKTEKRDYTGTYVGALRGKALSMYLNNTDKNAINGTIFDRNSNYMINGEIVDDGVKATAVDTIAKTEFSVDGTWVGDTLIFMMAMTRPMQTTRAFPVKFLKVMVSTNQKGMEELTDLGLLQQVGGQKDSSTAQSNSKKNGTEKSNITTNTEISEHNFPGLWQIVDAKGKAADAFRKNVYYLFNGDKSISKLDKTIVPLDGYYWNIGENKLFLFYKINGRMDEVRPNIIQYNNDMLKVKDGESEIELKKYNKG